VAKAVFVNMVPAVSQCLLGWQARKYRVSIPVFKTKILIMLVVKAELYGKKKTFKKNKTNKHIHYEIYYFLTFQGHVSF